MFWRIATGEHGKLAADWEAVRDASLICIAGKSLLYAISPQRCMQGDQTYVYHTPAAKCALVLLHSTESLVSANYTTWDCCAD
jgi:hypothetical protein